MRKISELTMINMYIVLFIICIGVTAAAKLDNNLPIDTTLQVRFESLTFTRQKGTCNINTISGVTEYIDTRDGGPVDCISELVTMSRPKQSEYYAKLNKVNGTVEGPSGKETYYNLRMSGVVKLMKSLGYDSIYWVREDGVKMYGKYIMVAADTYRLPKGTMIETTLGTAMVCDHCESAESYSGTWIDVAVNW